MQERRLGASRGILTTAYMNVVDCIAQGVSIRTVLQWIRWGGAVYWCQCVEQWDEMDTSLVRAKCQGFLSASSLASIVLCWPALYTAGRRNSSHIVCSVLATFCLHKSVCFCYDITHTHTRLTALYRWASTRKVKTIWILLKQETLSGSGISLAICKSAPRSTQITTPAPQHSVFTGRMPLHL